MRNAILFLMAITLLIKQSFNQCCVRFSENKCRQCPKGMHLYRDNCIYDLPNCQNYSEGFQCSGCKTGFMLIEANKSCIPTVADFSVIPLTGFQEMSYQKMFSTQIRSFIPLTDLLMKGAVRSLELFRGYEVKKDNLKIYRFIFTTSDGFLQTEYQVKDPANLSLLLRSNIYAIQPQEEFTDIFNDPLMPQVHAFLQQKQPKFLKYQLIDAWKSRFQINNKIDYRLFFIDIDSGLIRALVSVPPAGDPKIESLDINTLDKNITTVIDSLIVQYNFTQYLKKTELIGVEKTTFDNLPTQYAITYLHPKVFLPNFQQAVSYFVFVVPEQGGTISMKEFYMYRQYNPESKIKWITDRPTNAIMGQLTYEEYLNSSQIQQSPAYGPIYQLLLSDMYNQKIKGAQIIKSGYAQNSTHSFYDIMYRRRRTQPKFHRFVLAVQRQINLLQLVKYSEIKSDDYFIQSYNDLNRQKKLSGSGLTQQAKNLMNFVVPVEPMYDPEAKLVQYTRLKYYSVVAGTKNIHNATAHWFKFSNTPPGKKFEYVEYRYEMADNSMTDMGPFVCKFETFEGVFQQNMQEQSSILIFADVNDVFGVDFGQDNVPKQVQISELRVSKQRQYVYRIWFNLTYQKGVVRSATYEFNIPRNTSRLISTVMLSDMVDHNQGNKSRFKQYPQILQNKTLSRLAEFLNRQILQARGKVLVWMRPIESEYIRQGTDLMERNAKEVGDNLFELLYVNHTDMYGLVLYAGMGSDRRTLLYVGQVNTTQVDNRTQAKVKQILRYHELLKNITDDVTNEAIKNLNGTGDINETEGRSSINITNITNTINALISNIKLININDVYFIMNITDLDIKTQNNTNSTINKNNTNSTINKNNTNNTTDTNDTNSTTNTTNTNSNTTNTTNINNNTNSTDNHNQDINADVNNNSTTDIKDINATNTTNTNNTTTNNNTNNDTINTTTNNTTNNDTINITINNNNTINNNTINNNTINNNTINNTTINNTTNNDTINITINNTNTTANPINTTKQQEGPKSMTPAQQALQLHPQLVQRYQALTNRSISNYSEDLSIEVSPNKLSIRQPSGRTYNFFKDQPLPIISTGTFKPPLMDLKLNETTLKNAMGEILRIPPDSVQDIRVTSKLTLLGNIDNYVIEFVQNTKTNGTTSTNSIGTTSTNPSTNTNDTTSTNTNPSTNTTMNTTMNTTTNANLAGSTNASTGAKKTANQTESIAQMIKAGTYSPSSPLLYGIKPLTSSPLRANGTSYSVVSLFSFQTLNNETKRNTTNASGIADITKGVVDPQSNSIEPGPAFDLYQGWKQSQLPAYLPPKVLTNVSGQPLGINWPKSISTYSSPLLSSLAPFLALPSPRAPAPAATQLNNPAATQLNNPTATQLNKTTNSTSNATGQLLSYNPFDLFSVIDAVGTRIITNDRPATNTSSSAFINISSIPSINTVIPSAINSTKTSIIPFFYIYSIKDRNDQNYNENSPVEKPKRETIAIINRIFGNKAQVLAQRAAQFNNLTIVDAAHITFGRLSILINLNQSRIHQIIYADEGFYISGTTPADFYLFPGIKEVENLTSSQISFILKRLNYSEKTANGYIQILVISATDLVFWKAKKIGNVQQMQFYYELPSKILKVKVMVVRKSQLQFESMIAEFEAIQNNLQQLKITNQNYKQQKINLILNKNQFKEAEKSLKQQYGFYLIDAKVVDIIYHEASGEVIFDIRYETPYGQLQGRLGYSIATKRGRVISLTTPQARTSSILEKGCKSMSSTGQGCLQCSPQYYLHRDANCYPKIPGCGMQSGEICLVCNPGLTASPERKCQ